MTVTAGTAIFLPTPLHTEHPDSSKTVLSAAIDDNHALMIAVRDGDIDCLGELFERHHRRLYAFCVRLTRQSAAAEDIVQNVFHRILKYRHTYRDDGNFTTWMYHLARTCAANFFEKQSSVPTPVDPSGFHARASAEPAPDAQASQSDDLALLRAALDRLPREHREILILSRLQNLEHREAARILDCSVGAAKVRAHRALKALRATYLALRDEIENPRSKIQNPSTP